MQEYLTRGQGQPYPPGVPEAVLLNLDASRTGDQGGMCTEVMEAMAVLSAAGVSRELLYTAGRAGALGDWSEAGPPADMVDRALTRLAERSLLTFSQGGQTIIAHQSGHAGRPRHHDPVGPTDDSVPCRCLGAGGVRGIPQGIPRSPGYPRHPRAGGGAAGPHGRVSG